ncbi:MAG: chalcone isomerase family protein [Pseudomonadota bacterium]
MWCSAPWCAPDGPRRLAAAAQVALTIAACGVPAIATATTTDTPAAVAPAPPTPDDPSARLLPGATVVGQGTLRYWGFAVYDATLLAAPGWRASDLGRQPLVLTLRYQRGFRGADIARRSLEEMRRAGPIDPADEAAWLAAMQRVFPDVRAGDRIAGLWQPGVGARFVLTDADGRQRILGDIADTRFAERFFGIWLAPTTSEPTLRQALLGPTATTAAP